MVSPKWRIDKFSGFSVALASCPDGCKSGTRRCPSAARLVQAHGRAQGIPPCSPDSETSTAHAQATHRHEVRRQSIPQEPPSMALEAQ